MLGKELLWVRAYALWFPLAVAAAACGDRAKPTDPGGGEGEVSGRVALVKTAAGVPNAIVALLQGGDVVRAASTDTEGRFVFADVPPGTYTARLTGLELTGLDLRYVSFAPLEEQVRAGGDPVEVFFAGNGLVAPHVVGNIRCSGSPVMDARVRVVGGEFDTTVSTNVQGTFSATNLSAGNYAVILASDPSGCAFDPLYRVVQLRSGQAATADFTGTH